MPILLGMSFAVNVFVLATVVQSLFRSRPETDAVFGVDTPSRRIVLSVYLAILIVSIAGLAMTIVSSPMAHYIAVAILPMQILYKLITLFMVGWINPVVKANLAIAALHLVTLVTLYLNWAERSGL